MMLLAEFHLSGLTLCIDGTFPSLAVLTMSSILIRILVGWSSIEGFKKEYIIAFSIGESFTIAVFCMPDTSLLHVFFESVHARRRAWTFCGLQAVCVCNRHVACFFSVPRRTERTKMIWRCGFFLLSIRYHAPLASAERSGQGGGEAKAGWAISRIQRVGSAARNETHNRSSRFRHTASQAHAATGTIDLHIPLTTESIYIWLPEAHVEALTAGSVILAGILSKLGTYGFLRFSVPMFPGATLYFTPFIYTLSIIAYSSVAYMNFVTTGMSSRAAGIEGSILPTSSYGPVLLALSSCVGPASTMPNFSTIPLLSTPANIMATSAALGMILGAAYPLWPHNRVVFGNSKPKFLHRFSDLNRREVLTFLPSIPGEATVKPPSQFSLECMHTSVSNLVQHGKFSC
ncbi:hypothetical protein KP509_1Z247700 [Ceratopteris richardii]|nr:hypothetical protein KP509_1Z247700 [Ceratopteris richardii]